VYKIIVAHPHQQHSYRLATALQKAGWLESYITTVYLKKGSLTEKILCCLKGINKEKAAKRRCEQLPDTKVIQIGENFGLFYLLLMRLCHNDKRIMFRYNRIESIYFGRRVAKYAIKHKVNAVIGYDSECTEMFKYLKKNAPHIIRIMDVSAANRIYMKEIYIRDMKVSPDFAQRLARERVELFASCSQMEMKKLENEISDADYFLAPSAFVKESLRFSGVKEHQMLLCPYGVDLSNFPRKNCFKVGNPIEAIYVGGIKQLKGISYLLKAFNEIDPQVAHLTVVGAADASDEDILPYIRNVSFTGTVVHSQISYLLQKSNIFVFPSLGDSFSLSALEAAASGLPLIVSNNTGMIDGMQDGKEGFIIPVSSKDAIMKKVLWFSKNKEQIETMGKAAAEMAKRFTWEKYYDRVNTELTTVLENNQTVEY